MHLAKVITEKNPKSSDVDPHWDYADPDPAFFYLDTDTEQDADADLDPDADPG